MTQEITYEWKGRLYVFDYAHEIGGQWVGVVRRFRIGDPRDFVKFAHSGSADGVVRNMRRIAREDADAR